MYPQSYPLQGGVESTVSWIWSLKIWPCMKAIVFYQVWLTEFLFQ